MKKKIMLGLILVVGALLISSCAGTTSSTKLVTDTSAASNAATATSLTQTVNESMASWTAAGSVSGDIVTASVKAAVLEDNSVVTGPDANSYYHVTEEVTTVSGTYEADLYVKLTKDGTGKVTDTYIYGTFVLSLSVGGSSVSYTMTFGSGAANPYHGTATWSGSTLSSIGASGPLSLSIASAAHTTVLTMSLSSFTLPVTSGADYPTGTITIALTYDGVTDPNTYTIVYNGTSTATVTYGTYTSFITVPSS